MIEGPSFSPVLLIPARAEDPRVQIPENTRVGPK